jgi:hypothetical protein
MSLKQFTLPQTTEFGKRPKSTTRPAVARRPENYLTTDSYAPCAVSVNADYEAVCRAGVADLQASTT